MRKKDFNGVIDNILYAESKEQGTVEKETVEEAEKEKRTYIVRTDLAKKIKAIAVRERVKQGQVIDFALSEIVRRYEAKNGEILLASKKRNISEIF